MKPKRTLLALAIPMLLATATGCIRSRVIVTSDPPGAEVTFNGRPRGATPISIPFIWYWHHEIIVEKPGYEPIRVTEHLRAQPWFYLPVDLVAEMLPFPIPDERQRHYILLEREEPET